MFTGFSPETGAFLWELSFNNERPWFLAHKEQFERCLNEPFKALAQETLQLLTERCPQHDWQVHVSRIYRDARRLFGRGPYKDHLWFTIQEGDHREGGPCFWFEIGPAEYSYGLSNWGASPDEMALFRRRLEADPARFARLAQEALSHRGLRLIGEAYKRPKGDLGPALNPWYNRRSVGLESAHDLGGEAYRETLPRRLADTFVKLMPLYDYLLEVHTAAGKQ